jgi:hypothetical protein
VDRNPLSAIRNPLSAIRSPLSASRNSWCVHRRDARATPRDHHAIDRARRSAIDLQLDNVRADTLAVRFFDISCTLWLTTNFSHP